MITLILSLAILGFLVWLVITYIPMPDLMQKIIMVIAVVLVILYLIRLFNLDIPITGR